MKKRITTREYIEKSGLNVIRDNRDEYGMTTTWIVEKDGKEFAIYLTNNYTNFEEYFTVYVKSDNVTLGTRCLLSTAIKKIKAYK